MLQLKNKSIIIVGNSPNSRLARFYFDEHTEYTVVGYALNRAFIKSAEYDNLRVYAIEDLAGLYPPGKCDAFVAVGYNKMNKVREKLYHEMKALGYNLPNYISPRCSFLSREPIGDNNLILEDNTIQPFVTIGSNNVLWSGNHIGHDGWIGDHNFITSQVVVSGFVKIKNYCFLGVNATIRDGITIENDTLVAAGAIIMKDTIEKGVYLPARSVLFDKRSDEIEIS
jgi:sugar O-acyltransferase (sialic acid O-acetyltransferase NeuD family)